MSTPSLLPKSFHHSRSRYDELRCFKKLQQEPHDPESRLAGTKLSYLLPYKLILQSESCAIASLFRRRAACYLLLHAVAGTYKLALQGC